MLWILAQAAVEQPPVNLWQVAAQSGFNAVLVMVLLYGLREQWSANRKETREWRKALDRNTLLMTIAMIQMAGLQPGIKEQLSRLKEELHDANLEPKEDA